VINTVQFLYIITVAFFGYKLGMILVDTPIGMVLGIVGYLLALFAWFWIMPGLLDAFAMSTCIEMMKNRECINLVIRHQKFERAKRSFRIYQIFKLIRREMILEFQKAIPDKEMNLGLKKQVIEAFLQVNKPDSAAQKRQRNGAPIIRNDLIFSLIRLCGGSTCLGREECFILMKKIHLMQRVDQRSQNLMDRGSAREGVAPGNHPTAFFQLNNFIHAIEMVMNDVKLEPYVLTHKLLLTYYSGQEQVRMADIKKFFARFEQYFQPSDIQGFLKEVALLKREDDLVDIKEIASMVKNDVDMMPK